ncbi:MAG: endonuclease/exonuclease/phosphatase family protein [Prolixibacteraceae bacterium]
MKGLKYIGYFISFCILLFTGYILYSQLSWYNPPEKQKISANSNPDTIRCDSVYCVLSWNIGYAGLGDDMDFFYDGGKMTRGSYERTVGNLDSISHFLKRNSGADFILVQEVDLHSKRSYYLSELDTLLHQSTFHSALALNYVVGFVPVPLKEPMGKVNSGILSLSRFLPESSFRYAYPGKFGWPNRLFNLRRCMLANRYPTDDGKELVLINTHNSAFDDGNLKKQEMQFLKDFVLAEFSSGNYVVVGGDWNQSPPDFPITQFGENYQSDAFILSNIARDYLPAGWKWAFDPKLPTNRYNNEIYTPGKTFRCLIDIFLVSPNVEVVQNKTFDLNFRNSDHNPIEMQFRLKK